MPEEHEGLVRNQESGPNNVAIETGSIPVGCTKLMRGSFNGKITGFHPVVKGSIPLPRTSLGYLQQTKIFHFLAVKSKQYPV